MKKRISELISTLKQIQLPSYIKKSAVILITAFFIWLFFIHYNDSHHVSISRNYISGEVKLDTTKGIKFSAAWVQVIKFDTRPIRVCLDCSCANINCRLISFNPSGWKEFIDREGVKYFWFKNRISFNFGQDQEYRGIKHVLRGYAYDENHSFIIHHKDIQ